MKKFTRGLSVAAALLAVCMFQSATAQWLTSGTNIYNSNTGKVGIGTSTTTVPSGLLTVKGAGSVPAASWVAAGAPLFTGFGEAAVGNADYILAMASTSNNGRPVFVGRRSRGTLALPTPLVSNDFIMSMLASGYDGTAFQNPATIDFFVDGAVSAGNVPTRISFVTGSNSTNRAERLKIGNTGDITFNTNQMFIQKATGNVGIGTITPTERLVVSRAAAAVSGTQNFLAVETVINPLVPSTQGIIIRKDDGVKRGFKLYQDGSDDANSVFKIASSIAGSDVDRLTIKRDNGNVGIGTTTPNAELQFSNNLANRKIVLFETANNDHQFLGFGVTPGELRYQVGNVTDDHVFYSPVSATASNELMRIKGNGNVGIGTTTPAKKLEVAGVGGLKASTADSVGSSADWIAGNFGNASADSDRVVMGNLDGRATLGGHNGALNAWANLIINRDGGNVGIGTATPATKLDVNGFTHIFGNSTGNGSFAGSNVQIDGGVSSTNFPCLAFNDPFTNSFTQLYSLGSSSGFLCFTHQGGSVGTYVPISASAFNVNSDITLKKDITPVKTLEDYEKYMTQIRAIDAITYRYKDESANPNQPSPSGKIRIEPHVGFSAQSLPAAIQTKLPVNTKPGSEMKLGYNLSDMAGLTLIGIKALDAKTTTIAKENEELKKANLEIEKNNEELKAKVANQQAQIDAILQSLSSMKQAQEACCNAAQSKAINQNETVENVETPVLEQNAPNPVNNTTVIRYKLPSTVKAAQMTITDAKGTVIKSFKGISKN